MYIYSSPNAKSASKLTVLILTFYGGSPAAKFSPIIHIDTYFLESKYEPPFACCWAGSFMGGYKIEKIANRVFKTFRFKQTVC